MCVHKGNKSLAVGGKPSLHCWSRGMQRGPPSKLVCWTRQDVGECEKHLEGSMELVFTTCAGSEQYHMYTVGGSTYLRACVYFYWEDLDI